MINYKISSNLSIMRHIYIAMCRTSGKIAAEHEVILTITFDHE